MKRLISLLLVLLLVIASATVLFSCKDDTKPDDEKKPGDEDNQVAEGDHPKLKAQTFDGATVTIMARGADFTHWRAVDIYAEEENGDRINDAVYKRNRAVENKYDVNIAMIAAGSTMKDDAYKEIVAGTASFDIIVSNGTILSYLAQNDCLTDLYEVDNLYLDQPWWDQNAREGLSIGEKLYFTCSDLTISDKDGTFFVTFNKKILEENQLENPYLLVQNNEWTWDKFYEMAKEGSRELTGDGKMDENDQYGISTEAFNAYAMFNAAGESITKKDENNYPYFSMNTDRAVQIFGRILEFVNDTDTYTTKIGVLNFTKGQGLFGPTTVMTMRINYHEMASDFGILPIPKYDASQDRYYHVVSIGGSGSVIGIPKTTEDYNLVGTVLEALTFESSKTLIPEYYDSILENRYLRDEESREMLNIIFGSRIFDIAFIYNWGGFYTYIQGITAGSTNDFASNYDKNIEKAQADLDATIALYQRME